MAYLKRSCPRRVYLCNKRIFSSEKKLIIFSLRPSELPSNLAMRACVWIAAVICCNYKHFAKHMLMQFLYMKRFLMMRCFIIGFSLLDNIWQIFRQYGTVKALKNWNERNRLFTVIFVITLKKSHGSRKLGMHRDSGETFTPNRKEDKWLSHF